MKHQMLTKKQVIINAAIITIVTIAAFLFLSNFNVFDDLSSIKELPIYMFLLIGLIVIGYILCDSFIIYRSYKRIDKSVKFKDAIGLYLYGNLGSSITPSKAGHYPMKIYYMQKKGHTIDQTLSVITRTQIIYSFVNIVSYSIMFIVALINNISITLSNGTKIDLVWISLFGFIISILSVGIFLLAAYIKPISILLIKIEYFFTNRKNSNIVKEEYIEEKKRRMNITRKEISGLIKNIYKEFPSIISNIFFLIFNNCLPYFIYLFLSEKPLCFNELLYYFSLYQTLSYITTFFPVPGSAGIAESSFVLVFKSAMGNYVGACLLLWRVFNYYILIIVDLIFFIIHTFKIKKRN